MDGFAHPRATSTVSLVLADDHVPLRSAIRMHATATPWIEVVGEASDGIEALELIRDLRPAVAVVDLRMPGASGLDVAATLADEGSTTKVVVFSAFGSRQNRERVAAAGATFVDKTDGVSTLIDTIAMLVGGDAAN